MVSVIGVAYGLVIGRFGLGWVDGRVFWCFVWVGRLSLSLVCGWSIVP
jgi:hypothetical protein